MNRWPQLTLTRRDATGDAFVAGIALSLGDRSYNHEDRLYVMPVDRLWQPGHT